MLIDIFTDRYEHVGTEDKHTAHADGLWHRTFSCLALRPLCCAPTARNVANLRAENIPADRITQTGNTIVEVLTTSWRDHSGAQRVLAELPAQAFTLATVHRPENVDDSSRLQRILCCLADLDLPVLISLHPRTRHRIHQFDLQQHLGRLQLTEPPSYPAFLALAERAALLISDSGGVQEEASVLKKPLLVLRRSTERPEVLGTFAELVPEPEQLPVRARSMIRPPRQELVDEPCPFGDTSASQRILTALTTIVASTRGRV